MKICSHPCDCCQLGVVKKAFPWGKGGRAGKARWFDGCRVSLLVVVWFCRRGLGLTLGALLDTEPQLWPAGDDLRVLSKDWDCAPRLSPSWLAPSGHGMQTLLWRPPSDPSTALVRTLEALPQSKEGNSLPWLRGRCLMGRRCCSRRAVFTSQEHEKSQTEHRQSHIRDVAEDPTLGTYSDRGF